MKRSIFLAIVFALSISTTNAQWKKIKGNGKMTTETRTTSDYDGIKCSGSFDYILVSGTEGQLTLEGESNLLEHIVTEVKDGKLHVRTKKGKNISTSWNKTIKVTIPVQDVSYVSLSGSGDLWNEGTTLSTGTLDVALSGSGDVVLDVNAQSVSGKVSGSGDLTLRGTTNSLKASVAGSGDFHGFDLKSVNTDVSVNGSGDAAVYCSGDLKARVSGSGDIEYRGNPKTKDTKVSGSGSIDN